MVLLPLPETPAMDTNPLVGTVKLTPLRTVRSPS